MNDADGSEGKDGEKREFHNERATNVREREILLIPRGCGEYPAAREECRLRAEFLPP
jgi:hypothetical protein